jgi:hypothetical protein
MEDAKMRTTAEVAAAKIQHVARRLAEGHEVTEGGVGVYLVWINRHDLLEVVASEYGRPYAYPIPRDADAALTPADLMVKYAADRRHL